MKLSTSLLVLKLVRPLLKIVHHIFMNGKSCCSCLKTCPTGLEPAYAGLEVPCVSITLRAYETLPEVIETPSESP